MKDRFGLILRLQIIKQLQKWLEHGQRVQTAGWVAGGQSPESPPASALHEQYNGSAWSEAADLQTGRLELYGVGTQAAGLVAGGATPGTVAVSEEWNGSAWAEGDNLNLARKRGASGGTQTAAFATGGTPTGVNNEIYNGTSWAEDANLNAARYYIKGSGTSTAGLVAGGVNPSDAVVGTVEAWNGTAWTEVADLNTARRLLLVHKLQPFMLEEMQDLVVWL